MRVAILRKRAQHDDVAILDGDVLDVIAGRMIGGVRALEGGLIRVVAYASLTGREPNSALADEVLASLYPHHRSAGTRRAGPDDRPHPGRRSAPTSR